MDSHRGLWAVRYSCGIDREHWEQVSSGAVMAAAVANGLNELQRLERLALEGWPLEEHVAAWREVRAVLEPSLVEGRLGPLAQETIARFRQFARACPVTLDLNEHGAPVVGGDDPRADLIHLLWSYFFADPASGQLPGPAWTRLRRCPACGKWFADATRNRGQRWCSTACHNRAWNRAARRAAGHSQYSRRRRQAPTSGASDGPRRHQGRRSPLHQ